jgi:hypothetical protein
MLKKIYKRILSFETREKFYIRRKKILNLLLKLTPIRGYFRLRKIRNKYKGKRCFIFGNGPSLNKMDLELFKNEYTWGSNRCYLLYDKISWKHNFFISVDTRVLPDISDEVNDLVKKLPETTFFFPFRFYKDSVIKSFENIYFYNEIDTLDYSMSLDAASWVSSVCTVTIAAIQMAVYLGFEEIYLVGCDTSYTIPPTVKYENNDPFLIISTKDDDPNHFDSKYFGAQSKWHDPHVDRMIAHYKHVKEICDKNKIKIFNATVGGNLEVFTRVNYLDILNKE